MSRTESTMVALGTAPPAFALTDAVTGKTFTLQSLTAAHENKGLLVMFVCAHCPYVQHLEGELARIGSDYYNPAGDEPIAIVAIQPNDIAQFPEDGPEGMRKQAIRLGWSFPYLLDDTQQIARAYGAACTPDFFLFGRAEGGSLRLAYRGQLDDSRPQRRNFGNDIPVNGKDLRAALDAVAAGRKPAAEQRSSIGCNIKWRE